MNSRRRAARLTLLLLVGLVVAGVLWLRAQQRQYALNRQLIAALIHGDDKKALALVNEGADPNTHYEPTPILSLLQHAQQMLHRASPIDESPTALLIACGAPWDDDEDTFYRQANRLETPQLLQAMLSHGANVNARDGQGETPLLRISGIYPNTIRLLLESGADVNARTDTGLTRLMFNNQSLDVIRLLVEHGANANAKDRNGWTPLQLKVQYGAVPGVIPLLLEHGANVNTKDSIGWTPLMCGIRYNTDAVHLLLQHGADVNAQDENGDTALYLAVQLCPPAVKDLIRQLRAHGADPNLLDKQGDSALKLAQRSGRPDLVTLLQHAGTRK